MRKGFSILLTVIFLCLVTAASALGEDQVKKEGEKKKIQEKQVQEQEAQEQEAQEQEVQDEKAKDTVRLGDVVVTATRTEHELSSAPASIGVVTKEDIQKRGVRSVDEALNNIPGVYNARGFKGGTMDSLARIHLRGVPGGVNTLIMVDGIVLNDAYSGAQRTMGGIAPSYIERIEVVKGPFSSLYGGNAVGGVVNIMTRMPEKREFLLKTGYGSEWNEGEGLNDLVSVYVSGGDRIKDKLSFLLSYGYKSTDGFPCNFLVRSSSPPAGISGWSDTTNNAGDPRYLIGDRGDKSWWDDKINAKLSYDFSDTTRLRLSFTNARFEYDYSDPNTYLTDASGDPVWSYPGVSEGTFLALGGRSQGEDRLYGLSFETELWPFQIKTSFGYADKPKYSYITPSSTATFEGGPGVITSTPSSVYNADLQATAPLGDHHILTFGAALKHGKADTSKFNLSDWDEEDSKLDKTFKAGGEDITWSVFAQDEIKLHEKLTAYFGIRQDWWKTYGGYTNVIGDPDYPVDYPSRSASAFSPKAALVYQPFESTTLRTSIGRSFRPPTVYELYSVWIYRGVTTMADPSLEPEKTTSWDVGVEQKLWKGAKVGVTYFENYMKDLIYKQTVSATLSQYTNTGSAESRGVEFEIEQRFDKLARLFASYTYTDSEVTDNLGNPDIVGMRLTQLPEHMFNVGGDFTYGRFSGSLVGHYVSKRYNTDDNSDTENGVYTAYDPYFVADARLAYQVTDYAEVAVSMDNIFDEDYYSYYKAPGRSWFVEMTLKF